MLKSSLVEGLKIMPCDPFSDLSAEGGAADVGGTEVEAGVDAGVVDLFDEIVGAEEFMGGSGRGAGQDDVDLLGPEELPKGLAVGGREG